MLLHLAESHEEPDLQHNKDMPFNREESGGPLRLTLRH